MISVRLYIVLLLIAFKPALLSAEKYALIVAISHFEPKYGIHPLHSANDVPFVVNAWKKEGFKQDNIKILVDSMATKKAVWAALNDLKAKCKPGDIVWLHFTTHGQKLQDFNGYSTDGYAKSLIMYDSPSKYEPGYHGQRHLTDEELRAMSKQIRLKLGNQGELTVTIDACHSGLMMRGVADTKGIPEPLTEPGYNPAAKTENMPIEGFYSSLIDDAGLESQMASYVFYSACRSAEVCSETVEKATHKAVGPLSLALSHALVNMEPGITFRQLFNKILAEMNNTVPNQTPVMAGNGMEKVVFGGDIKPREVTFKIKNITGKDTVEIAAGTFAGIYNGTELAFYKVDDLKGQHVYARGTVVDAGPFNATLILVTASNPVGNEQKRILEARITKRSFGNLGIQLAFDEHSDRQQELWLFHELINESWINVVAADSQPDLLARISDKKNVELIYPNGTVFRTIDLGNTDVSKLSAALLKFTQLQAIKALQMDNPLIDADVEINAMPMSGISDTFVPAALTKSGEVVSARAGKDVLQIKITNTGAKIFYINILDIQPDGVVNPFFPGREMDEAEYKVMPSMKFTRTFNISPPYGMERLKVILSGDDINLGVIAGSEGTRGSIRGGNNPIELFFRNTYNNMSTRGVNTVYDKMDNATTLDLNFLITE